MPFYFFREKQTSHATPLIKSRTEDYTRGRFSAAKSWIYENKTSTSGLKPLDRKHSQTFVLV